LFKKKVKVEETKNIEKTPQPKSQEFFYGTQYHTIPPVENDSYVIEKDVYITIRRLRLILYHWFF
jgi:hypothetical protein